VGVSGAMNLYRTDQASNACKVAGGSPQSAARHDRAIDTNGMRPIN